VLWFSRKNNKTAFHDVASIKRTNFIAALDFSWSSPVVASQSISSSSASAFARSLIYGAAMASISYSSVVSTRFDESE
jgi:hypothetical protein